MQNLQPVYLRAAHNFGLGRMQLFRRVILPAALPQILTGVRIALGVAWLVVVAAEMIAVNSGLGYLIIDARNAGKRYDLVVAGMVGHRPDRLGPRPCGAPTRAIRRSQLGLQSAVKGPARTSIHEA